MINHSCLKFDSHPQLATPSGPGGSVYSVEEMKHLVELVSSTALAQTIKFLLRNPRQSTLTVRSTPLIPPSELKTLLELALPHSINGACEKMEQ